MPLPQALRRATDSRRFVSALVSAMSNPAPSAAAGAEGSVTVATSSGLAQIVNATLVGNGVLTKFVVKHAAGAVVASVTVFKEKGASGSEPTPGKIVAVNEVKILNENEIEVIFSTAPLAKEAFFVKVVG